MDKNTPWRGAVVSSDLLEPSAKHDGRPSAIPSTTVHERADSHPPRSGRPQGPSASRCEHPGRSCQQDEIGENVLHPRRWRPVRPQASVGPHRVSEATSGRNAVQLQSAMSQRTRHCVVGSAVAFGSPRATPDLRPRVTPCSRTATHAPDIDVPATGDVSQRPRHVSACTAPRRARPVPEGGQVCWSEGPGPLCGRTGPARRARVQPKFDSSGVPCATRRRLDALDAG